jgi:hypothetical protein
MGTELIDQAIPPPAVAKCHEPLGKEFDTHWWAVVEGEFLRKEGRGPVRRNKLPIGVPGPV